MVITHKHTKDCPYMKDGEYIHYLVKAAPDFLWFDVQDVGDYQGNVYGIALYKNKIAIYEDGYGSCSGCGAWGEGGEPKDQEGVIKLCSFYTSLKEALEHISKLKGKDDAPDFVKMELAAKEAYQMIPPLLRAIEEL